MSLADSLATSSANAKASNFSTLHQHIDDLTREKFELMRGLQEQQKVVATLSDENLTISERFNRQVIAILIAECMLNSASHLMCSAKCKTKWLLAYLMRT